MATANTPNNIEIHDTAQATGTTYSNTNIKTGASTNTMQQGREIRNGGLNIVVAAFTNGVRGWDRTNLSTAPLLWNYTAGGDMRGLASKPTTTWFLGGRSSMAQFYKFHFEVADNAQLTYATSDVFNMGFTWYMNSAYIM
jgi:hypothetical protein